MSMHACILRSLSPTIWAELIITLSVDPIIVTTSEEYRDDNVTVAVEWTEEEGMLYNITIINIVPQISIESIGRTSVQLTLLYNIEYNISVEAALPCQNQVPSHVQLFYGELNMYYYSQLYYWRQVIKTLLLQLIVDTWYC